MKNIRYTLLVIIAITIGFNSCNKDEFLMEDPKDKIYAENLLQNYAGLVNMLNSK